MVSPEQSSEVQCVVDWFGPTDITALVGNRTAPPVIKKLLGGELTDKADVAKLANPITHLSKSAAPFLIIHGDKDPLVPLSQSELLHNALKKEGVPSELIVIKGGGHGGKDFTGEAQQKIVDAFFDKHLKKK
jgi:dipeptidyl aminopeptidase/acylaminoacyl peptidase